jgi:ComF family protein
LQQRKSIFISIYLIFMALTEVFNSLIDILYPPICPGCIRSLKPAEKHICLFCRSNLSATGYFKEPGNPVEELFWGRLPFERAAALFWFRKETTIQHLLHALKYKGREELGEAFGIMLGHEIRRTAWAPQADCILPVPMHPRKKKKRGYNQAECIAIGMASVLQLPVVNHWVEKTSHNRAQALQSGRFARWKNVEKVYAGRSSYALSGKKVILVDDVVTTGATLEACALQVLQTPGTSVYLATVAFTR